MFIFAGPQQARDVTLRVLLSPGDAVWLEEPAHPRTRASLEAASARIHPVGTGGGAFDARQAEMECPEARLAYVFAAKQVPIVPIAQPMAMGAAGALLDFARRRDAWIIEDAQGEDYILPRQGVTLHSAAARDRVVYLGAFGRALFPALRIGFAIVPPSLAEAFAGARAIAGGYASLIGQMIVTDFMADGHLEQHVHRMRKIYAARRDCLLEAAQRHAAGRLVLGGAGASMQMVRLLPQGQEAEAARRAEEATDLLPREGGHGVRTVALQLNGEVGAQEHLQQRPAMGCTW
ncbi:MAG: transcriptional regulator, GntR family [Roseomonas sp.]|nr:transcriptional regulator, GntR family [Roseomonas sp.]